MDFMCSCGRKEEVPIDATFWQALTFKCSECSQLPLWRRLWRAFIKEYKRGV